MHWQLTTSDNWTSGFWPGALWYAFELSKDTEFKQWAIEWTRGIERQKFNLKTHDLGFRFGCSFGNGLRLAPEDSATRMYNDILLTAAATMDKRFSPLIGAYTSDWDSKPLPNSVPVVIDIMMNLELLFWASQHGGGEQLRDHCLSHANTTYRDFIRDDGGSVHIVRYDQATGSIRNKGQLQGDVDSSTWSRGQAWMIYGLTTVYRYTKDPHYLSKAMKVADYFINHLPADKVAPWDFQSKIDIHDASASAIVTSALFELQGYMKDVAKKNYYLDEAKKCFILSVYRHIFQTGKGQIVSCYIPLNTIISPTIPMYLLHLLIITSWNLSSDTKHYKRNSINVLSFIRCIDWRVYRNHLVHEKKKAREKFLSLHSAAL